MSRLFRGNRFVTFGIPFFVLVIGGSFGMTEFAKVRYEHRAQKTLTPEEMSKEMSVSGVKMRKKSEITLEKEFERIQKMDIDTWENKRGPRPWEPDNPTNLELEERAKARKVQA